METVIMIIIWWVIGFCAVIHVMRKDSDVTLVMCSIALLLAFAGPMYLVGILINFINPELVIFRKRKS